MMPKVLIHYGTKGMHWGERHYQNKDGSLTPEGLKRYRKGGTRSKGLGGKDWNPRKIVKKNNLTKASQRLSEAEKDYINKSGTTKKLNKKYLDNLEGSERKEVFKEVNDTYNAFDKYKRKTGAFQPGDEGPVFKTENDFKKGKIDKKGTALADAYDKAQSKLDRLESRADRTFDKYLKAENAEIVSLSELSRQQKQYLRSAKNYIDDYGRESYDKLNTYNTDTDYVNKFINDALDDFIDVQSGKKSATSFNRKYAGTGWKYVQG